MSKLINFQWGDYLCQIEVSPKTDEDEYFGREFHVHSAFDTKTGINLNMLYVDVESIQAAYEAEEEEALENLKMQRMGEPK